MTIHGHFVFKKVRNGIQAWLFELVLVPTIMARASKCVASGSSKESIPLTSEQFNFDFEDDDFKDMCLGFMPKNTVADMKKCMWSTLPVLGAGQILALSKR